MNKLPAIFIGVLLTFASAWLGLVAYSVNQLGRLEPFNDESSGAILPPQVSGLAAAGRHVYAANGCVSCHSQQVRPSFLSSDVAKAQQQHSLQIRRTVARDYLRQQPAFLGNQRTGPDLSNVGLLSDDNNWFHRHLYEPSAVAPGSVMPSYRFLYEVRKISGQPSMEAVQGLTGPHAPQSGYEVVPTEEAKLLVAYLRSLKRNYPLPEAPVESSN